ncbi:LUD domain-containing protein [Magnetospirillum sp. UT-4]|uniref:LutC/YkgG family protein n=1 Tax=Magnetospirillum sp. UT-4 TaxID=2681467 RepID=UPI0013853E95|nr:LUD domain-containing protein [Magnetospirillum sp. UT-4]CAA7621913.1 putative L-lactate dehydrogenase [Magnetospirillum sp. UT-4]
MSDARATILDSVRRALRRGPPPETLRAELDRRMAEPRPNVIPARGKGEPAELIERFAAMATEMSAIIERIPTAAAAPAAVARLLAESGLPPQVAAAPALSGLDWTGAGLSARFGAAGRGDAVSVVPAFRAVAETGTCIVRSGPDAPTTLNFLPDLHVVLVRTADVVGAYEDAWKALRKAGAWPRTVTWITGPSRTADIEQTLLLGAHGPRRLHVLLADGP